MAEADLSKTVDGKKPKPVRAHTALAQFADGLDTTYADVEDNYIQSIFRNSALNPRDYGKVFKNPEIGIGGKAAYVAGRLAHDVLSDGTRVPWWALNHPLAITGVLGRAASDAANLTPDRKTYRATNPDMTMEAIDDAFSREMGYSHGGRYEGVPLAVARYAIPAMAATAMVQASGNHDMLNALGGGRSAGFQAVLPSEEDNRVSTNPVLEAAARYIFGRSGRLLPWEEFTQERPDVSESDYKAYAAYQFDKGPLGIGLFKGTSRNIDGEPEGTLMGFRVPLSAATATGGAMVGAIAGARQLETAIPQTLPGMRSIGHRRLAGAAIGALLGSLSGKAGGEAVNDLVIQPLINPEAVARAAQWTQQQQIAGLL